MKISIDNSSSEIREPLLSALAWSCRTLGHVVSMVNPLHADQNSILIAWNGRGLNHSLDRVICCENGWLPRSSYQVQVGGINASGHLARRAKVEGIPYHDIDTISRSFEYLDKIRRGDLRTYQYNSNDGSPWRGFGRAEFLLSPLQMHGDLNMEHAPDLLRDNQSFIDFVSESDPPYPVAFKQHPADLNRGNEQLGLMTRRDCDIVVPHKETTVGRMLKSEYCLGVVTINSNVAHEAMAWGKPVVALGRGMWPEDHNVITMSLPSCINEWEEWKDSGVCIMCVRHYLAWLIGCQWDVKRASDPRQVELLLREVFYGS